MVDMIQWLVPGRSAKCLVFFWSMVVFLFWINTGQCVASSLEDQVQIPGSPNPIGSGARALGMGGAFIAVADDATAASWNPGGLIQLEKPEISIVGAFFDRSIATAFADYPEASGEHAVSDTRLNYFSASYPFQAFHRNMTISLNYQNLYDFTNQWHFPIELSSGGDTHIQYIDAARNGSLSALGLAWSVEVVPDFSLGLTLNFWEDSPLHENEWKLTTRRQASSVIFDTITAETSSFSRDIYHFSGFNVNLGALWHISGRWTLGAVIKTPFEADLTHDRYYHHSVVYSEFPDEIFETESFFTGNETLTMPLSYGIGLAYRFSDNLTVSGDLYRTEWGNFIHEASDGKKTSPVTGTPESEADIDATHQVRLGGEYLFIRPKYAIPLRAGIFYDPAPAQGSPDDYFGFSLGSGIAWGRLIFDIAFQYRFGNDVGQSFSQNMDISQDVRESTVYSSLIIHF